MINKLCFLLLLATGVCISSGAREISGAGAQAVFEAQEANPVPAPKKQNALSALKQLCKERHWHDGWDSEKRRAFVIETAEFDCNDPANDPQFFIKREMAAKRAVLSAKVTFIQTINQKMSAEELSELGVDDGGNSKENQMSAVETMAKMPLFGATVIMQTESWDSSSGKYQLAILLCWSMELERMARAIATGEDVRLKPSANSLDIHDWLEKQDLATMIGPRQYVDKEGRRWFLGVTARPYSENLPSVKRRQNKNSVELFAQQMAAFSLFADVEGHKLALSAMETGTAEGGNEAAVAEGSAERLTQAFQNKKIRGLQRLAEEEVTHPITGEQIIVAVYGVNASDAHIALAVEKIIFATAVKANQHQAVERGRDAANQAALANSANNDATVQNVQTNNEGANNDPKANVAENTEANGNGAQKELNAPTVQASEEWILCIGEGASKDAAVKKALIEGIRQFFGTEMSGNDTLSTRYKMLETDTVKAFSSSEKSSSDIMSSTRGFVSGYRIVTIEPITDGFEAKVNAKFVNPRGNGVYALMVYPMTIPISKQTNTYTVAPKTKMSGAEFGKILSGTVEKAFADSGKFIILNIDDLKNVIASQNLSAELVDAGATSPAEMMRAGNLLTADYIVTTSFDNIAYSNKLDMDKATRKMVKKERMTLSYAYKILDVKSGQQVKSGEISCVLNSDEIKSIRDSDEEMSDQELAKALLKTILTQSAFKMAQDLGL